MNKSKSYHLLHSPGFVADFLFWVVAIGLFFHTIEQSEELSVFFQDYLYEDLIKGSLLHLSHEFALWSTLSLLSSSCCAFQLILNAFSFGCAGFNSTLGPLRPMFLALTTVSQFWMWSCLLGWSWLPFAPLFFDENFDNYRPRETNFLLTASRETRSKSILYSGCGTLAVLSMSLLPEVVYLWNTRSGGGSGSTGSQAMLTLKVEGMACVACVAAVRNLVETHLSTTPESVDLDSGEVKVLVDAKSERDDGEEVAERARVSALCAAITDAGFPCQRAAAQPPEKTASDLVSVVETSGSSSSGQQGIFPSYLQVFTAGMLGSSCCLVQLFLNLLSAWDVFHMGCAGFNTALGPQRPVIRALVVGWLAVSWLRLLLLQNKKSEDLDSCCSTSAPSAGTFGRFRSLLHKGGPRRTLLFRTGSTLLLLYLPELLRYGSSGKVGIAPGLAPSGEVSTTGGGGLSELQFVTDNMGCEACEISVKRILSQQNGVVAVDLDFETGTTKIWVAEGWGWNDKEADAALRKAGYELKPQGWVTKKMKLAARNGGGGGGKTSAGAGNPFANR
eukprot:g914.t1